MRIPKRVYFNPFFRLFPKTSNENHIFVVGPPRSGTTLVASIISNHPAICSFHSETALFSWRETFLLFEGKAGRNSYQYHRLRQQARDVVSLCDALAAECKEEKGGRRFLEKTPQHVLHLAFILKYFPKAQIINIVRDPRDGFASSRSNASIAQKSAAGFARYWKRCVETRQRFGGHPQIYDIGYETMVAEPDKTIGDVIAWLGESFEKDILGPDRMKQHHLAGSSRFRHLGGPINPSSVGRWKRDLSAAEIATIEEIVDGLHALTADSSA